MSKQLRGLVGTVRQSDAEPTKVRIPSWNPRKEHATLTLTGVLPGQIIGYHWSIEKREPAP